jgi:hypothetical protein
MPTWFVQETIPNFFVGYFVEMMTWVEDVVGNDAGGGLH